LDGLHLMQVSRNGYGRILIAENRWRRFLRFTRVIGTQKRDRHCSGAGRRSSVPPFHLPG